MFVLARFRSFRVAYSYSQRLRQAVDGRRSPPLQDPPQSFFHQRSESLFTAIDANRSVEELRKDGLSLGFDIPPALVREIHDLACTLPLQNSVRSKPFLRSEVSAGGHLPDGQLVSLGTAYKSRKLQLLKHECVSRVVNDPVLLKVVSRYLGYWPKRLSDLELYWSFTTGLSFEDQMRQGNAIDYHFDLHGYNFVMAAFYITDTDRTSGAHVMFKKSHHKKTLPMLFSYSQPANVLRRHYGSENETMIEGKAGTGFVMDNSTYHRATTPESADRLLLRLVYT